MNPLHEIQSKTIRRDRLRNGLSIIEVLTSIVVAMIGVFGVMILIPFAVKQAQIGLDSDAAVVLGRNAHSQFEISGYRTPSNWGRYRISPLDSITPYRPFEDRDIDGDGIPETIDGPELPQVFSIDPLGIYENGGGDLQTQFENAVFPFNRFDAASPLPTDPPAVNPYPDSLTFEPVTLGTPTGAVMSLENAQRFMRTTDDLVYGEAADVLLGPEQIFDSGAGIPLRRQSRGHLSWSAIVVPFKPDYTAGPSTRWSYKMFILVYKDRQTLLTGKLDDKMATALVTNTGIQSPVSNVFLDPDVTSVEGVVNRDDWVMLVNRDPDGEFGFQHQLAFYRVINVANANGVVRASLTLDGSDFTFTDPTGNRTFDPTFVVHLKNVVGVYERTFESENESTWN